MTTRSSAGSAGELRRRVHGWRAAEQREHTVRAAEGPMTPAAALAAALELLAFEPPADERDPIRAREIERTRTAWRLLRARLTCPLPGSANR